MEKTLVLLKPDTLQRSLVGPIISRLEQRGLTIIGLKLLQMDNALASKHYSAHVDKPFFGPLVEFITSGPIVMFGTKCPSITSMCIKSAPAFSRSLISLPSLLKSADKIEGEILILVIRKFIFLYLNYVKKKEGREFPPFLNILSINL